MNEESITSLKAMVYDLSQEIQQRQMKVQEINQQIAKLVGESENEIGTPPEPVTNNAPKDESKKS
jgi:hypothetical protein